MLSKTCLVCDTRFYKGNTWEGDWFGGPRNPGGRRFCSRQCSATFRKESKVSVDFRRAQREAQLKRVAEGTHNLWKGGSADPEEIVRKGLPYQLWREAVLERDGSACVRCGNTKKLHAHHIKSFAEYPDLRLDIANGETLCAGCHMAHHRLTKEVSLTKKVMSLHYAVQNEYYALGTAAAAVTLTTAYTNNVSAMFPMQYHSQLTVFVEYTPGAGGGGNSVQIKVEGSPDLLDNYGTLPLETVITPTMYQETASSTSAGTITHTAAEHTFVGAVAGTVYRVLFYVPPAFKTVRFSAKETVVGGSAGTLKLRAMNSGA